MENKKKYDADSIQVLEGLEAVRKRPVATSRSIREGSVPARGKAAKPSNRRSTKPVQRPRAALKANAVRSASLWSGRGSGSRAPFSRTSQTDGSRRNSRRRWSTGNYWADAIKLFKIGTHGGLYRESYQPDFAIGP